MLKMAQDLQTGDVVIYSNGLFRVAEITRRTPKTVYVSGELHIPDKHIKRHDFLHVEQEKLFDVQRSK